MLGSEITLITAAVTILALIFYFYTGIKVGHMRTKHNCPAPAMSGAPEFERAMRVQMNTLEWLPIFIVLLWLATIYFSPAMTAAWLAWLPPVFGLIWIVGRILYMTGYMAAANKRGTGFSIAGIAIIGLLIMSIAGIVMAWNALSAV